MNQWRSPTAERLFRDDPRCEARSAGVSPRARRRVSLRDLQWADLVLCMEREHRARLLRLDDSPETRAKLRVLDVPDLYRRDDPELAAMLRAQVGALLDREA